MTTTAPQPRSPAAPSAPAPDEAPRLDRASRPHPLWLVAGTVAVAAAALAGVALGPAQLPAGDIVATLVDRLPLVDVRSALSPREAAILWQLRVPRVVLSGLVGAMLATAGAGYQGVFRNPLADPYLLGVAAGAGLGATLVFAVGPVTGSWAVNPLPVAAFAGALAAVAVTYVLSRSVAGQRDTVSLILAGVAVSAFLTAAQTFVQQRDADSLRRVYTWLLGRLATTGWTEVRLILPYVVIALVVLLVHGRLLDVLSVGDREATSLGVAVSRVRLLVVVAASLGTAAAVAVSGLIGFVGIIVPHTVRLATRRGYRAVVPLSLLFGAAFLILADLVARTALAPAELPIGVVTASVGAPFFAWILRRRRTP